MLFNNETFLVRAMSEGDKDVPKDNQKGDRVVFDLEKWGAFLKTVGFPIAVSCFLLWMVYSAGMYITENLALPLFRQQQEFINDVSVVSKDIAKTVDSLQKTLDGHNRELDLIKLEVIANGKNIENHSKELKTQTELLRSIDETLKKK